MRRILVDAARRKGRVKHGGGRQRVDLDDVADRRRPPADDLLALDDALDRAGRGTTRRRPSWSSSGTSPG